MVDSPDEDCKAEQIDTDDLVQELNGLAPDILDQIARTIKEFNSCNIQDITNEQIATVVSDLRYVHFSLPYRATPGIEMWRVRKSAPGELYAHTDDLKYPPALSEHSRVAHANEPIFYGSSSPETAFSEARLTEEDFFHLGKFGVRAGSTFHVLVIGDLDHLRRRGRTFFDRQKFQAVYRAILDRLRAETSLAIYLVDAFMADWLGRKGDTDVYRVSQAITRELLSDERLGGVIFPSVEHSGGLNYAVKKDCYDSHMQPLDVSPNQVRKVYGYGAYEMNALPPTPIDNSPGKIDWPDDEQHRWFRSLRNL